MLRKATITAMLETEQAMLPQNRVTLEEDEIPTRYYNIQADLREPLPPPLDPKTKQPVNPAALERLFAKELIRQEISSERYITIPDEVLQAYLEIGRPTFTKRGHELWKVLASPRQEPSGNSRYRNKRSARRHRNSR